MVTRWSLFFGLLTTPLLALAAELEVTTHVSEIEMGKFLRAEIVYVGNRSPDPADLRQWQQYVRVDRRDTEKEQLRNGAVRITEHLRLYPRRVGQFSLAPIAQGGAVARPVPLTVTPLIRNGIDATPRTRPLPARIWQGQSLEYVIEQALISPSNNISAEAPRWDGFDVRALPRQTRDEAGIHYVSLHWLLTPHRAGRFTLEPPAIEQRGRGRWRFHLERLVIDVRPLPAYLPPNLPVGRIEATARLRHPDPGPVWEVDVRNQGLLIDEIYGLRSGLAALAGVPVQDVLLARPAKDRQVYRVAVPDWSWGLGDGPALTVDSFDTVTGRRVSLHRRLPAVWQVPEPVTYALWLVLLLIAATGMYGIWRLTARRVAVRQYRQRLLQAGDAHTLRRLLLQPGRFHSLDAWADRHRDEQAHVLARELNALCFSARCRLSLHELKQTAAGLHN